MLGPLALEADPGAYDLCEEHATRFSVPRGWQVVRLATTWEQAPANEQDFQSLADAVRKASQNSKPRQRIRPNSGISQLATTGNNEINVNPGEEIARCGHLRLIQGYGSDEEASAKN